MGAPDGWQTRVYKYWCEPASPEDRDAILRQVSLGNNYMRDLVDAENALRDAVEDLEHSHVDVSPAVSAARTLPENSTEEDRAAAWKTVRDAVKVVRATPEYKDALIALRAIHKARVLAARSAAVREGLAWGTYQHVDEAHGQACRAATSFARLRWDRDRDRLGGGACVHIQGRDLRVDDAVEDAWVRISPKRYGLERVGIDHRVASSSGAQRLQRVELRLGTGRVGKLTALHVRLHREMPPEALIRWARVHVERVGARWKWNVQFVIAEPPRSVKCAIGDTCGVDLGWRRTPAGLRVASSYGTDGRWETLEVPNAVLDRASKCDDLRSIRDLKLEELKKLISSARPSMPEWFARATTSVMQWRSPARVRQLARECADRDLDLPILQDFVRKDEHLHAWQANNRRKMDRQIDALYDGWALKLAARYRVVGLEQLSLVDLKAKSDLAQQRGAVLGVGFLREAIKRRFGGRVRMVKASGTTARCSGCGAWRARTSDQIMTCHECGMTEDRDLTAGKNICARAAACEAGHGEPLAEVKPKKLLGVRRTRKKSTTPLVDIAQDLSI